MESDKKYLQDLVLLRVHYLQMI
uniref:Uncharacterized protein n=1 Tax=Arundo donax TaxID=35708 RepID=A0A0A8YXD5_ARUDO